MTAWNDRPIFSRLPEAGYGDNAIAEIMTAWPDAKLMEVKATLEDFYKELDPYTAKADSLSYLAFLVGLSDQFWAEDWTTAVKRAMIAAAPVSLWPFRGTMKALRAVLDIHGLDYEIWRPGVLTLPFPLPGSFGNAGTEFYIRLPLRYQRSSLQWQEAVRSLENFGLFGTRSDVVYQAFYLGFSRVGDPLF